MDQIQTSLFWMDRIAAEIAGMTPENKFLALTRISLAAEIALLDFIAAEKAAHQLTGEGP